ncbi:MAG: CHRD domain-containing protein [Acidobacteriota bacterium]|nr:CHRD domain-containing protein [Acidobacteriota bacterium]MDQ5871112.1 CHRD domain-containing protein [Acidobacteriota bacterium]
MAVGRARIAVALLLLLATGCASVPRPDSYCAELRGAGPGSDAIDPEARGSARLTIEGTTIRFRIRTENLGKVVATHLHAGAAGVNGPMAHELNPGFTGELLEGSTTVTPEIAAAVVADPSRYYVKLHSLKFPGGAIRGQLEPCERGHSYP